MKRWLPVVVFVTVSPLLIAGCKNQANPSSIPDGVTSISENMVGKWDAPGGTSCRWWMTNGSKLTDAGNTRVVSGKRVQQKGAQADQSQTVFIGTGNVGDKLHSDNCGPWTP